ISGYIWQWHRTTTTDVRSIFIYNEPEVRCNGGSSPTGTNISSESVISSDVTANNGFEHPQALGGLIASSEIGD
nr:chaperonin CPN60/TCP-1 [Tanacetum cinerariifolium]